MFSHNLYNIPMRESKQVYSHLQLRKQMHPLKNSSLFVQVVTAETETKGHN